jgi:hypothetical protein
MKFFYADSLDLVDPEFDFVEEKSLRTARIPQRDDVYAHELVTQGRPYDGLLVSKALFRAGGGSAATGKYTQSQRQRFLRVGAQRFLRFPANGAFDPERFPIMGDCGAFTYRDENEPPYTIDELVEFYDFGGFTHGISLDHVILGYDAALDESRTPGTAIPAEFLRRQELTLANAARFLETCRAQRVSFQPLGAAQGWSPDSYRKAARALVVMGYDYIAVGGLVPLKTHEILDVVEAVARETAGKARLHLLGVTRLGEYRRLAAAGVASFDSSSPIRQAFKDGKDNYYSLAAGGHYTAVRVPQSDGPRVLPRIREGRLSQAAVEKAEGAALRALRAYDRRQCPMEVALEALRAYQALIGEADKSRWTATVRTLRERPWEACPCSICTRLGIEIIIFRGANRNRRRGFHNLWWTYQQLMQIRHQEEVVQACA